VSRALNQNSVSIPMGGVGLVSSPYEDLLLLAI